MGFLGRTQVKRLEKIADILTIDIVDLLDGNTTVNNINNNAEHTYGIVENLYTDNKDYIDKIITGLEKDEKQLLKDNKKLHTIIKKFSNRKNIES